MKKILLFATVMMAFAITANATVWRLNNRPGTDADFSLLQEAHDAELYGNIIVQPGDTLYLEASSGSYGNLIATKKLIIIGAGYFHNENPNTQADFNASNVGVITFNDGSQGSGISGCSITNIVVNTSEIVIERNYVYISSTNSHAVRLNTNNINNIIIRNNFIINNNSSTSSYASQYIGNCITALQSGINNVIIKNNYLQVHSIYHTKKALELNSGFSGVVENNVIFGHAVVNNCAFNNNILRNGDFTKTNTTWYHNIANDNQFGDQYGNQQYVGMLDVFIGMGTTDGKWQLKPNSPAIGAGVNGIDCGMFGGDFPYILSGVPAIPTIYFLQMGVDNVNQQIEVEMNVKSRN